MIHIPVLLNEIKAHFELFRSYPNPIYLDGTFGRGGHYRELKKMIPQMKAIAFDQDPEAIKYAQQNFSNEITNKELVIFHDNFANFDKHYQGPIDFALLDLGVKVAEPRAAQETPPQETSRDLKRPQETRGIATDRSGPPSCGSGCPSGCRCRRTARRPLLARS